MAKVGSKGKYNTKTVDVIYSVLAKTGIATNAIKAVGISRECYYNWIKVYPEFAAKVEEAMDEYRESSAYEARLGYDYLIRVLEGKEYITKEIEIERDTPEGTYRETRTEKTPVKPEQWFLMRMYDNYRQQNEPDFRMIIEVAKPEEVETPEDELDL